MTEDSSFSAADDEEPYRLLSEELLGNQPEREKVQRESVLLLCMMSGCVQDQPLSRIFAESQTLLNVGRFSAAEMRINIFKNNI